MRYRPNIFIRATTKGTVAVRYIVEPLTSSGTRLRIDGRFRRSVASQTSRSDGQSEQRI